MSTNNKQEVSELLCQDLTPVFDDKSIDDAIVYLERVKNEPSKSGAPFLRFKIVSEDEGEYDYHETFLRVYGIRLETQEEYDKRIFKQKTKKEKKLAKKRAKRKKLRRELAELDAELGESE